MNETIIFIVLFSAMFFFHELGHVVYAKRVGIYKGVTVFRLYHLSKKIPQKGLGMLILGAGTKTDLEKETLHQRVFNCLWGTLAGLPFLIMGWLILPAFERINLIKLYIEGYSINLATVLYPSFECVVLVGLYMIGFCVDLVNVLQIAIIGRKKGFDLKLKEVI